MGSCELQAGISTQQLLNVVACLAAPSSTDNLLTGPIRLQRPPLVDGEYSIAKRQLILHEQLLLRSLHFEIAVEHPYKYFLNFCNLFNLTSGICQTALCAINDSLSLTQLCLSHHPSVVAAGALKLALEQADAQPALGTMPQNWPELIGVTTSVCQEVSRQMQEAISHT